MRFILKNTAYLAIIAISMIATNTAANAQIRAYRVNDRQVQTLLNRIERQTNTFQNEIDRGQNNNNNDGTSREDSINALTSDFEVAINTLKSNFESRRSTSDDVQMVLSRATLVNRFMQNNRMSRPATSQWNQIRTDLNILANYYNVRSDWSTTVQPPVQPPVYQGGYTVNDSQMRVLLNNLKFKSAAFRRSYTLWNSRGYRRDQTVTSSDVTLNLNEMDHALDDLGRSYNNNSNDTASVESVLKPYSAINSYILSARTSSDVSSKWNLIRTDLSKLAGYYGVNWDWNNNTNSNTYPGNQYGGNFDSRLTGTYRLNSTQSENLTPIVDRAIINANYSANQRDQIRRTLERRLMAPETLTLEKNGQQVTMSSTNGRSIILNADGTANSETSPNGRTVTTRVTATDRDLTINYEGDRANAFYVSFMPMGNGQLKVIRRVYLENQNQTVTAYSVYDKTSQTPQWNTTADFPTDNGGNSSGGFIIPNNTAIVATLDTPLSTKTAKNGDRFSMTVNSPSQYNGAVIEGSVTGQQSGVVSGRANLSVNFQTIRLQDGRTYTFAGIVESVRETNGNVVNVNNEGAIRDSSQTTKTITRAGIGAILGGIIGAIAGGGSGAAIGAGVGAGAGAGTVILQGRDNLELSRGSQFTITATAPSNVASQ